MKLPRLPVGVSRREMVDVFLGYEHTLRVREGAFFDMENLTSDCFPVLSPRPPRGIYARPASPQGLIGKDVLCYVDGADFVVGDVRVEMGLSTAAEACPKRLTSMGSYVIILPDKKYLNTADTADFGDIDAHVTAEVTVSPWEEEGFVKLEAPGLGAAFREGDGVNVTGIGNLVIRARGADFLVIPGTVGQEALTVTVERRMPEVDFLIESENRLWGCRYGDGVNEIYASKLGDFRNWNCFQGVATDSFAASCGTDGPFTGAVTHLGIPLFFKENCVHKVYGSYPANFSIRTTACRGVQKGCGGSLAIVNETLYYKSRSGICAYDGSLPVEVSQSLGAVPYGAAVGGAHGSKYYVCLEGEDGWQLFVYDTARGLWHREDKLQATAFCSFRGELYCIDGRNRNILTLLGSAEPWEGEVQWMARTGELALSSPDSKYLSRLAVRLSVEPGTEAELLVRYDGAGEWVRLCSIHSMELRSISVPVTPRRCDHMALMLRGRGGMKLHAITKTWQEGSGV